MISRPIGFFKKAGKPILLVLVLLIAGLIFGYLNNEIQELKDEVVWLRRDIVGTETNVAAICSINLSGLDSRVGEHEKQVGTDSIHRNTISTLWDELDEVERKARNNATDILFIDGCPCSIVCPDKAGMFSGSQSHLGKSQKPSNLNDRVMGNQAL